MERVLAKTLQLDPEDQRSAIGSLAGVDGSLPGASDQGDAAEEDASGNALARLLAPFESRANELRDSAGNLYENLKERFDIRPDNGWRSTVFFAPILFVIVFAARSIALTLSGPNTMEADVQPYARTSS